MGVTQTLKSNTHRQRRNVLHHRLMHVTSLGYITVLLANVNASEKLQVYHIAPQSTDVHQMTQQTCVALNTEGKTTYSL